MSEFLASPKVLEAFQVLQSQTLFAIWESLYSTVLATLFAYVIGLPLGVLLFTGEHEGIRPLPHWIMSIMNLVINILRSIPFLILTLVAIPLTRAILGTSIGTVAMIPPLVLAAFPFVARLVETSLRETDKGIIEAAQSMGATPFQIVWKVMLPETMPSLVSGATTAFITILGYGAMAGMIGGGGLGKIAITYGSHRFNAIIMWAIVIVIVALVQIFQSAGTRLSVKSDKRIS